MPFQESTTSVTTSATALGSNGLIGRARVLIFSGGNIWIGSSTVTTATGVAVASNAYLEIPAPSDQKVYAITNVGTATVRTVEVG